MVNIKEEYAAALAALGYSCRYNEVAKRIEVNGKEYSDFIKSDIMLDMLVVGKKNRQTVNDTVFVSAAANTYNPIKERIEALNWDGTPRINSLAAYLHSENEALTAVLLRKWLIGAVSKLYNSTQNMVLIIQGGQGIGKSQFVEWLASPFPNEYFAVDDIDPRDKDYQIRACTTFIWEAGEFNDTTTRKDPSALKRFLTTKAFKVRLPYASRDSWIPTICNFAGTVNDTGGFLVDQSGNRRFWIIKSKGIDFEYSNVFDPADIWAEAYAAYKSGEAFTLTPAEAAANEKEQATVEVVDLVAEKMKAVFDIDPDREDWFIPISEVRDILLRESTFSSNEVTSMKLSAAAVSLKLRRGQKRVGTNRPKCYIGIKVKDQSFPPDKYDDEEPAAETFSIKMPAGFEFPDDIEDVAI